MRRRLGGGVTPLNSPLDLSGLAFWFRAPNLGLSDGTAVATWTDLSGLGRDLTQGTGANQPIYKTGIQNGLAVVRFTIANSTVMSTASFALDEPSTVCLAATNLTGSHNYCDALINDKRAILTSSSTVLGGYAGTFLSLTVPSTAAFNAIQVVFNITAGVVSVNGRETMGNIGNTTANGLRVGTGGNGFADMDLGEIFGYSRDLNATERKRVQLYLKRNWATP